MDDCHKRFLFALEMPPVNTAVDAVRVSQQQGHCPDWRHGAQLYRECAV
jgi:hypothetical protein